MSNLQDDFVVSQLSVSCNLKLIKQALNVNACEEGDPIFTCNFKTEMVCALLTINGGNLAVNIGPT